MHYAAIIVGIKRIAVVGAVSNLMVKTTGHITVSIVTLHADFN
jgi:hypothetical protein